MNRFESTPFIPWKPDKGKGFIEDLYGKDKYIVLLKLYCNKSAYWK